MASQLEFVTLDVFTTTPFKGNPLGVVHLPPPTASAPALSQAQKQAIAREFNLSETVFVLDVSPGSEEESSNTRRIDIFTPVAELPFAGHPVIGTASYLKSRGVTKLIAKAGPIPITFGTDEQVSASIPHNVHLNSRTLASQPSHSGLSADPQVRAAELAAPPFSIVPGMTFVLIRLPSLELLAKPVVGPFAFDKAELMDEGWRDTYVGRSYYVVTGSEVDEKGARVVSIRTRMIDPMLEDPATGSAACALTSYLSLHEFGETELKFQVTQGVEMGRRSDISVEVEVGVDEEGGREIRCVSLGGTARQIMKGTIAVPPL